MTLQRISFAEALTFSRAGEATFTGSNGLLQTAAAGVPRFDYDPVTLAPKGILIEGTRQNMLLQSGDLTAAAGWSTPDAASAAATYLQHGVAVPVFKLTELATTAFHALSRQATGVVSGTKYAMQAKLAPAERGFALFGFNGGGVISFGAINLATGEVSVATDSGGGGGVFWSRPLPNGAWQVFGVATATAATNIALDVRISLDGIWANRSYAGVAGSGIYVWHPQLEAGAFPSSYIHTTTMAISRAADNLYMTPEQFAPWYRQDAGSIGVLFRPNTNGVGPTGAAAYPRVWEIDGTGAPSDGIMLTATSDGGQRVRSEVVNGSSSQVSIDQSTTLGTGALTRHGFGVKANDFAVTLGGAAVVADATGTIPTPNRLTLGSANAGAADHLFGHIAEFLYFPQRLANADLQQVCA